ncbi:CBS domain-containing protein [Streptomyces lydicus]|uniref:restriction system modified-DNA reader domain-containing protein n=1 Tax=Streptomyces lydicus TaxID=47763 RepID=UPI00378AA217
MSESAQGVGRGIESSGPGRASYLIAGRRVRISDLVDAGLLTTGAELVFRRPRVGETHTAAVSEDHTIRLTDGRRFASPSKAAHAAVGNGSFDGWNAWTLGDGTTLDSLRQRLLDSLAEHAPEESEDAKSTSARHEKLKKAREAAADGQPVTLTVRELFGWWGAHRRGYVISNQVAAELSNHALSTSPHFGAVPLDASVRLISSPVEKDSEPEADEELTQWVGAMGDDAREHEDTAVDDTVEDGDREPVMDLTVGRLDSALAGVISVSPNSTFEEAITMMTLNDYSQLPVVTGGRTLRGVITWESIVQARHTDTNASLSQAIVPAQTVAYDQHLVDVLPQLAQFGFVLVRDETNIIAGIVTASDAAEAYGALATPFSLIGELDQRLRRIISDCVDLAAAIRLCDPDGSSGVTSFDDMSFGDYQRILENPAVWTMLNWPLDRKVFVKRVDELRKIRNELMHFNSDGIENDDVRKIRRMIAVIRTYSG